jgi:N4-gp56 family major capsid protein
MAAPYTDTSALSNLVTTAYDQYVRLALSSTPMFRSIADSRPVAQTHPGSSVVFQIHQELAPATTPLNEINDPTGVALGNTSTVSVTINEYGNHTVVTQRLKAFALDNALDSNVVRLIATNQADSVDGIVRAVLDGSANKIKEIIVSSTPTLTTGAGTADSTAKARDFRYAATKLRGASVSTWDGANYLAMVHPDVSHDLKVETGAAVWRDAHTYTNNTALLAGEIGTFEGVRYIENPRCTKASGVYNSYVVGREALAEAVAQEFAVVADGTIVDPYNRKMALGWYGMAGWALLRPQSLWVVQTTSSVG